MNKIVTLLLVLLIVGGIGHIPTGHAQFEGFPPPRRQAVEPNAAEQPAAKVQIDNPFRTWTSASGREKIEAKFVEVTKDGATVTLQKKDGKLSKGALEKLSPDDRQYVIDRVSATSGKQAAKTLEQATATRMERNTDNLRKAVPIKPGTFHCRHCEGTGFLPCSRCYGTKRYCSVCYGDGELRCRACEGCGLLVNPWDQGEKQSSTPPSTSTPPPTTSSTCSVCKGGPSPPCSNCNGSGRRPYIKSEPNATIPCPHCSGIGRQKCRSCGQVR